MDRALACQCRFLLSLAQVGSCQSVSNDLFGTGHEHAYFLEAAGTDATAFAILRFQNYFSSADDQAIFSRLLCHRTPERKGIDFSCRLFDVNARYMENGSRKLWQVE